MYDLIFDRFADLKLLFLQYTSISNFPNLSMQDMDNLANNFKLIDSGFKLSELHTAFYACNTRPQKGQTKMGLNRCEFIELLVRIAVSKYFYTKKVNYASEAVEKFLDEVILCDLNINPSW